MYLQTLIAIRLTRSRVGFAVFNNTKLEFVRCLNLPGSSLEDAVKSLRANLSQTIDQFDRLTLAIEQPESPRYEALIIEVRTIAKEQGLSLRELSFGRLLESYSFPPLKSRNSLRKLSASIWPMLAFARKGEMLDAAALGLYLQVERLLTSEQIF